MSYDWICKKCKKVMQKIDDEEHVVYCKDCNRYEAIYLNQEIERVDEE